MLSDTNGWAVGKGGIVLHYTGVFDLTPSTLSVSSRHVSPGEQLTYTIQLSNTGNIAAPGVQVTSTIPLSTTYVAGSASTTQGTVQGTDPVVVSVGDIAPGGSVTINFAVTVGDPGLSCWFVSNTTDVTAEDDTLHYNVTSTVGGGCSQIFLPLLSYDYRSD